MTWIILQLLFCALPFVLSLALYKSRHPCMIKFYFIMAGSAKARKLYVQVWLILLLLFHYVYTSGHPGEFGILLSTTICAVMFSFKITNQWLRSLLDRPRAFGTLALIALVIGFVPHLYTTAVTALYILLATFFYPSVRVMTEYKGTDILFEWTKHPERLSESYYDHHHAGLPYNTADSGNLDISAYNNHQKLNENEV